MPRVVREEPSEEKTTEQILNAEKGEPWRYLRREHSGRGNETGAHWRAPGVQASGRDRWGAL